MAGGGDHSATRRPLAMGRAAAPDTFWVPAVRYTKVWMLRSGQVPRTTLGSGPGPKLGARPPTSSLHLTPVHPFPTTRLRESFVLGVRRGSLRVLQEGSAPRRPVLPSWRCPVHTLDPQFCLPPKPPSESLVILPISSLESPFSWAGLAPCLTVKETPDPTLIEDAR